MGLSRPKRKAQFHQCSHPLLRARKRSKMGGKSRKEDKEKRHFEKPPTQCCARMTIRRLMLDDDDDEEIESEIRQVQPPNATVTATRQPPNSANCPSEPFQISDDDEFIDVSDNLSPPSPPPQPQGSSCPVGDSLRQLGLGLKREWLGSCLRELEGSVRGFAGFDVTAKAKLCFEQFLFADMNSCGSGVLPPNVHSMHRANLSGPYVLQVDEIVNICCSLKARHQPAPPGVKRSLKLSMTDGIQRVFGLEYRPIPALEVCASAGLKVAISNVHVRRGLLILVPETIEVLGGLVEHLDAARKRLVEELSKPPRGARTRNQNLPPLATRATLAAWPSSRVDDLGHTSSMLHSTDSVLVPASNQGAGLSMSGTGNNLSTEDTMLVGVQNVASNSIPHTVSNAETMNMDMPMHTNTNPETFANSMANQFSSMVASAEEMHIDTGSTNITRENSVGNQSSHMLSNVTMAHKDTVCVTRETSLASKSSFIAENVETDRDRIPAVTDNVLLRGSSSTVSNSDDVHMVDDSDHPCILPGNQEIPFTYIASLSAKWAAMKEKAPSVQGKIKCFLTGVKGFQYKKRTTYELEAYVDDGSLISEILIDHHVVQKGIGYSPEEVTAALSSPDKEIVQNMKETMRKFQTFLANFEGVILVELNRRSSLPLALEMSQGCSQSDASLLLRRLKSLYPAQIQKHFPSDPIELSP